MIQRIPPSHRNESKMDRRRESIKLTSHRSRTLNRARKASNLAARLLRKSNLDRIQTSSINSFSIMIVPRITRRCPKKYGLHLIHLLLSRLTSCFGITP
jgi:hypothetical protein